MTPIVHKKPKGVWVNGKPSTFIPKMPEIKVGGSKTAEMIESSMRRLFVISVCREFNSSCNARARSCKATRSAQTLSTPMSHLGTILRRSLREPIRTFDQQAVKHDAEWRGLAMELHGFSSN